ncbi:MAG: hypothetical protein ABI639_01935 [Thermoanaerobaculia bacterium]
MNSPTRRVNRRRALAFLLAGLALGELFYVAAFEGLARSGRIAQWLGRRPDRFHLTFGELHSYFPCYISARELDLAVQTPRVVWRLRAGSASGWIAPLPLLLRRFQLAEARIDHVDFALRSRRQPPADVGPPEAGIAVAPEMTAFEELRPPRVPTLLRPAWNFEFPRVTATGVHDLWIEQLHLAGEMVGRGGFDLRRRTDARVRSSRLEIRAATLEVGAQPFAQKLAGSLAFSSVRYAYREHRGLEALPFLDARLDLDGEDLGGALLRRYLARADWLAFEETSIPFHAALSLVDGKLAPGSSLVTEKGVQELRFFGFTARGSAQARFEVQRDEARPETRLELRFDDFELRRGRSDKPVVAGTGLSLRATTHDLRLGGLPDDGRIRLDLGEAHVVELSGFSDLVPISSGLAIAGGQGVVHGRLEAGEGAAEGAVRAQLTGVELISNGERFSGGMALEVPVKSDDLAGRHFDLSGARLELTDFLPPSPLAPQDATTKPSAGWWGKIELPKAKMTIVEPASAEGTFVVKLRDSVPLVALYSSRKDLPNWVEKLLVEPDVRATGNFSYRKPELTVTGLRATFDHWGFAADLELGKQQRRGRLLLEWRKLAVGVRLEGGKRSYRLVGAREWFEKSRL